MEQEISPSVPSRRSVPQSIAWTDCSGFAGASLTPLKGGDRFECAAARCCKRSVYRFCAVGGDRRPGELPISPLVGEMSAKLTEAGESHGRRNSRGNICAR
jgi:hypothetical protein